jgi:hypothetical protein
VEGKLVNLEKRKPIIAGLRKDHELNILLKQLTEKKGKTKKVFYEGTLPFEKLITTPSEIERILYEKIEGSLAIKDTGFVIKGEDRLSVVESVDKELTLEELFLKEIKTPEGVEDLCIRIISSGKLNYRRLLKLAKKYNAVNVVGCYLDIVNSIKKMIDLNVINEFKKNVKNQKATFLKAEVRYGKGGWEDKYEKKWNVDIFLDIGAIRHGVRAV